MAALKRDIEDLSCSEISEEQLAQLKRTKIEAERMCKEQEEELDDMAGQIQVRYFFVFFLVIIHATIQTIHFKFCQISKQFH